MREIFQPILKLLSDGNCFKSTIYLHKAPNYVKFNPPTQIILFCSIKATLLSLRRHLYEKN